MGSCFQHIFFKSKNKRSFLIVHLSYVIKNSKTSIESELREKLIYNYDYFGFDNINQEEKIYNDFVVTLMMERIESYI